LYVSGAFDLTFLNYLSNYGTDKNHQKENQGKKKKSQAKKGKKVIAEP